MANKIFSMLVLPLTSDYAEPSYENIKDTPQFLGSKEGRSFFSFNPETVTLTLDGANKDVYDIKVYDLTNEDDLLELNEFKETCNLYQNKVREIHEEFNKDLSHFELFEGFVNNDQNI